MLAIILITIFNGCLLSIVAAIVSKLVFTGALNLMNYYGFLAAILLTLLFMSGITGGFLCQVARVRQLGKAETGKLSNIFAGVIASCNRKFNTSFSVGDFKIFVSPDVVPNSWVANRKTIIISEGVLTLTDEELSALLAHELGHIYYGTGVKITALFMVSQLGGIFRWLLSLVRRAIAYIPRLSGDGAILYSLLWCLFNLIFLPLFLVVWLYDWLCKFSVAFICRGYELKADRFVFLSGYGEGLFTFLANNGIHYLNSTGITRFLLTHPDNKLRMANLRRELH